MPPARDLPPLTPEQQALAVSCIPLACKLALRTNGLQDAIGCAMWHLCRAAAMFEAQRGWKFTTYAHTIVWHGLLYDLKSTRAKARGGQIPHIPLSDFNQDNGGWTPEDRRQPEALLVRDEDTLAHDDELRELRRSLKRLGMREQAILLGRISGKTLKILGQEFGVSEERVRQMEKRALQKLANWMRGAKR